MTITVGITLVAVFLMSKPIGAYQLGEAYAQNMGVNIKWFRVLLILDVYKRQDIKRLLSAESPLFVPRQPG